MEFQKIKIELEGIADIMFDRFIDHSNLDRPPEQKLYLIDENQVVLPAENIHAFLAGQDPAGCAKKFEGKKGKEYIAVVDSHIFENPVHIPFLSNGKAVKFKDFDNGQFYTYESGGRTKSGSRSIKQEVRPRPVLRMPWELKFEIDLIKNSLVDENRLNTWFQNGGILIGLGTYRPRFGRFQIKNWEVE